jgi:hypothetical protein
MSKLVNDLKINFDVRIGLAITPELIELLDGFYLIKY